jgi:predicted nucleic acid-binding protein
VSVFVVDASVVLKWFIPEVHSDAALRWLESSHEYLAPDLIFAEVGNAIWKKVRRKELDEGEAQRLAKDVARVAVEIIPMRGLLPDAEALALAIGITFYDAMYVALAARLDTQAITADDRLLAVVRQHPASAGYVRSVKEFME